MIIQRPPQLLNPKQRPQLLAQETSSKANNVEDSPSHSYTRRHNPNSEPSGFLLTRYNDGLQFIPFDDDVDRSRFRLSYPDDRVLYSLAMDYYCVVRPLHIGLHVKHDEFKYYICNPTIKQFSTFPNREFEASLVSVNGESFTYCIDIYSSETCSWRSPASGEPLTFTTGPAIALNWFVYCNDAIHWDSRGKSSLYFDTHSERLKTMPIPPRRRGALFHIPWYFVEFGGHLHLIVIDRHSLVEFDIWELKKNYSGWFFCPLKLECTSCILGLDIDNDCEVLSQLIFTITLLLENENRIWSSKFKANFIPDDNCRPCLFATNQHEMVASGETPGGAVGNIATDQVSWSPDVATPYKVVAELACLEESFEANIHDYTKLIDGYGKENWVQDAENTLLLALKRRGFNCDQVILSTIMIHMYKQAGDLKLLAEETFEEIKLLGQPLHKRSYGSIIIAYIRAGMPDQGELLNLCGKGSLQGIAKSILNDW
ncbi:hypothetical protein L1049_015739 [Liquidambar formosana]|uniref:Uncharacterized protein n=1 Tax=Liquidambar formosana TaxID=63359 RepID=A0AAP0RZG3_LIQFO